MLVKIKNNFEAILYIIFRAIKNRIFLGVLALFVSVCLLAGWVCVVLWQYYSVAVEEVQNVPNLYVSKISYEQAIIEAAKKVSPSVVSIVISKEVPIYEQQYINPFGDGSLGLPGFDIQIPQYVQKGTELKEVGAGSGFIVTPDGLILTNKHVVSDKKAKYKVITDDGQEYEAEVLALDPANDLAVIKIGSENAFNPVVLGDSDGIQIGQTAIAIGNALGEFSNTVSVGVVSGLGRTISASDKSAGTSETLENIIQTDAAINSGNSGGPLLNLNGEVIGVNTAMAEGAEGIGFALPINLAKRDIEQVIKGSKIVYPFLGVKYTMSDDGALISGVTSESAADKAGIKEGDIVLEINGEKITKKNSMSKVIQKYNPGDTIILHILRDEKEIDLQAVLGERTS